MKKSKFEGKLSLRKETVARLNDAQMNDIKGGSIYLETLKCPVIVLPTRTIPPSCTITTNTFNHTVISKDVTVVYH